MTVMPQTALRKLTLAGAALAAGLSWSAVGFAADACGPAPKLPLGYLSHPVASIDGDAFQAAMATYATKAKARAACLKGKDEAAASDTSRTGPTPAPSGE
ncbi:MAG: hypothetical protein PW843_08075 [Azospirillaceae bacterium]|nr:hypothetical protein [Azospirillaceae bacterium]